VILFSLLSGGRETGKRDFVDSTRLRGRGKVQGCSTLSPKRNATGKSTLRKKIQQTLGGMVVKKNEDTRGKGGYVVGDPSQISLVPLKVG